MTRTPTISLVTILTGAAIALTIVAPLVAQAQRPRAEVAPVVDTAPVKAGALAQLSLHVRLPKDIHVQSNKPKDPLLIPTVLTIEVPEGIKVESIEYPEATELAQPGRQEPLVVYGNEFAITAKVSLAASVPAGDLKVPGTWRYQACNDTVCFPPARATAEWVLSVK